MRGGRSYDDKADDPHADNRPGASHGAPREPLRDAYRCHLNSSPDLSALQSEWAGGVPRNHGGTLIGNVNT